MPRARRRLLANHYYHFLNRANRGAPVFHEAGDYHAFLGLIRRAQEIVEIPIIAACLMPNHVHLVLHPRAPEDLPCWARWLFTTHVRHYHQKHGTIGRLWQGRYKAFLAQDDHYLLTLIRYVERNALRKNLVARAEDWRWGSLLWRLQTRPPLALEAPPIALPGNWADYVNLPQTAAELEAIRASVNRQRPYGDPEWVEAKARITGLEQSMGELGRPRKVRSGPVS